MTTPSGIESSNIMSIGLDFDGEVRSYKEPCYEPFVPVNYGLNPDFQLSKFLALRIHETVPEDVLSNALQHSTISDEDYMHPSASKMRKNVSLNCSVQEIKDDIHLIEAMDSLYAILDDPFLMGKIACLTILNHMHALGVRKCDSVELILTIPTGMSKEETEVVVPLITNGFKYTAAEAGAILSGYQMAYNSYCLVGGTASVVCGPNDYVMPNGILAGDVLVLTKALGTTLAINTYQWLNYKDRWNRIKLIITENEARENYKQAVKSMTRSNSFACKLMKKYDAHGAIAIGTSGLLGHALELAKMQQRQVLFVIHNLPIIYKMAAVAKISGKMHHLLKGTEPEISGGLLISFPREQAAAFCKEIEKLEGHTAWIIGIVDDGNRTVKIMDKPRVIEVLTKEDDVPTL